MVDEAIENYQKCINIHPDSPSTYNNLGIAYGEKDQFIDAIVAFSNAIKYNHHLSEAYYNLGSYFNDKRLYAQSIDVFKKAINIDNNEAKYHNGLGIAYSLNDMVEEAIESFRKSIACNSELPHPHYNLGQAYSKKCHYNEALKEYRKAERLDSLDYRVHYNIGLILFKNNKIKEAIREYRKALRLNPTYARAHINLSAALFMLGKREEAIGEREKALSINPKLETLIPYVDYKLIFVANAYQEDMEPIFNIISKVACSYKMEAKRLKDEAGCYNISQKIDEMIKSARCVIVDLTHERQNVYYELGYARALNKKIITIVRQNDIRTKIHTDVIDWNYLPYRDINELEHVLIKEFEQNVLIEDFEFVEPDEPYIYTTDYDKSAHP